MKKIFIALALTVILSCLLVLGISAKELYLEEIPNDLKVSGDTVTHFLVIDGEEYYGGSGSTVNLFNMDKIGEEIAKLEAEGGALHALGYKASDLGTKFLTKLVFPDTLNGTTVTYVDINCDETFKTKTYFLNCGYLAFPSSMTKTNDSNGCNGNIRCIDFGENSQLKSIPYCFMSSAKKLIRLKNMPGSLETIEENAFRWCASLEGDENKQLYISAVTVKHKAFDNAMHNVEGIIFGANVKSLATESFSNGEVDSSHVKFIEFKCDVTSVSFPNCDEKANSGAFYFGANSSQRRPYENLVCIILSNPAQKDCDGKTFVEASGQNVYFNDVGGVDDYVYTSHDIESQNSCFEVCTRCELVKLKENPTHEGATVVFKDENGNDFSYLSNIYVCISCPVCGFNEVSEIIDKIVTTKGYSVCEYGEAGVTHTVGINKASLAKYEKLSGEKLYYGVVAGVKRDGYSDKLVSYENGEMKTQNNAVSVDFTGTDYEILDLKITNVNTSATVYCNAFIGTEADISYICDGTVSSAAIPQEIVLAPNRDEE